MEMQSLAVDQAADTANENAETRAEIIGKIRELNHGNAYLQDIPPENYKPIAAAIMLAVLDNRVEYGWTDTVVMQILMSRLLELLYNGDQPDSRMLLQTLWPRNTEMGIEGERRQRIVQEIRGLVPFPAPPAKKKGGRKSKKNKRSKRKQSRR
jgi:hypothetical protein